MKNIFIFYLVLLFSSGDKSLVAQSLGITGDAADVTTTTTQGIVLMGGGTDVDAAIKWMINKSGGGDFVVIRASGTNAYNSYIYGLGSVNSVETFLINSSTLAQNASIAQAIRNAEGLFIAGGDQSDYVTYWKNSPIEDAINYLINTKKAPVGGTSAGCAILTKVYYSAISSSVTSSEALADPYGSIGQDISYDDFISSPFLDNTISDTHYLVRGRQGRHATFLARMIKDKSLTNVKGIGVDEKTAVCIDETGKAIVFGSSNAVFIRQFCNGPETCAAGQKLTWNHGVKVYSV
ncbi:MAG: cyanophycinase, partial [Bacteroidetes bacterium]|nr:cyanophycinase [Bacteroidota bacterium]